MCKSKALPFDDMGDVERMLSKYNNVNYDEYDRGYENAITDVKAEVEDSLYKLLKKETMPSRKSAMRDLAEHIIEGIDILVSEEYD